jgi:L-lactate dehydrogenase complex protein LldG
MTFDTSKARASILQRIRTNQRRSGPSTDAERALAEDYLARHPAGPRPVPAGDLKHHFRQMAERMASTVDEVSTLADVPEAAARYLLSQELPPRAVVWPQLAELPWAAAGIAVEARRPKRDESQGADLVGITCCYCALAETGTLVLTSSGEMPASTHLLPETHIAVVAA